MRSAILLGQMSERRDIDDRERFAFSGRRSSARKEDAIALLKAGRAQDVLALLDQLSSDDADTHLWRGHALRMLGRHEDALQAFAQASQKAPESGVPYAESAKICSEQGDATTAMTLAGRANQLAGESEAMDLIIGTSLYELGRPLDALNVATHMLSRWPSSSTVHNLHGGILRSIGRIDEAADAFDRALNLDPTHGAAAYNRYSLKPPARDDQVLDKLREAAGAGTGDPRDRVLIEFALGRVEENAGRYDEAFAHFSRGAALMRRQIAYDESEALGQFEKIEQVFSEARIEQLSGSGAPAAGHIFVLGMPRSGTTLVEQILASHPAVTSAGETSDLAASIGAISTEQNQPFPEFAKNLRPQAMERLGHFYSSRVKSRFGDGRAIVDKMPSNYQFLGLIHLALPNAKIIHCRRDPLDTCVSIFTHVFSNAHSYSYDPGELGRYYRAYQALMAHWQAILPKGAFLDVDYEALVAEPENWSRKIVEYCDLAWDPNCLTFYTSQRQVKTATAAEVRRPVYASAVGGAQRYKSHLAPLRESLSLSP